MSRYDDLYNTTDQEVLEFYKKWCGILGYNRVAILAGVSPNTVLNMQQTGVLPERPRLELVKFAMANKNATKRTELRMVE